VYLFCKQGSPVRSRPRPPIFSAIHACFCFFVYTAVGNFVGGEILKVQQQTTPHNFPRAAASATVLKLAEPKSLCTTTVDYLLLWCERVWISLSRQIPVIQ
jgi:hypothetical protein